MAGYTSKSVLFGGTDEYVTMGNVLAFERTQAFSISFWFKALAGASGYIVAKTNASPGYRGYGTYLAPTGYLEFVLYSNYATGNYLDVRTTTTGYNDGSWHHVVWTYAGNSLASGVACYVDGAAVAMTAPTDALGGTIVDTTEFCLGRTNSTGTYLTGSLDEVAVYSKALSAAEVTWIYNGKEPRDLLSSGSPSNLVAWWRMGEGDVFSTLLDSGPSAVYPTVRDLSGNNYTGTMTSMAATDIISDTPGKSVPSMKSTLFGGTDEYVNVGNVLAFERTDSFSLSFWFKTTDTVGAYLLGKMAGSTTYRGYGAIYNANGSLSLMLRSDQATTNRIFVTTIASGWNDGVWHHVVWSYAGTSLASGVLCYVDGVLQNLTVGTDALTATIVDTSTLWLGGASTVGAGYLLIGSLDEVAIYSDVLSAAEALWIFNNGTPRLLTDSGCPSNLVGWWKMGDGDTSPTLLDSSGSGFSGTMTNMESTDLVYDSPINGTFARRCLQFNSASSQYVTMGNVLNFERTNPFSVSFWCRVPVSTTGARGVISKMDNIGPAGWQVYLSPTYIILWLANQSGTYDCQASVSVALFDGNWHHVVMTWDGDASPGNLGIKIYVDNVFGPMVLGANTLGTRSIVNTGSLVLGRIVTSSYFTGNLDEVSVYNRVLSSAEVSWIYNSGVPRDLKQPEAPKMLAAYWRLGENAYPGAMTNMESTNITNNTVYSNAPPVLDYAWRFKNNIDLNTTGTRIGDYRQLLLAMKNALKTASGWTDSTGTAATLTTPWTVVASSNGTVANTSDNWSAAGDLVWATNPTAHSWIVLRQTGINGLNVEFCVDLNITTNDYQISLIDSYGVGFNVSSPTVNNRPTATDERIRYSAQSWTGLSAAFSGILNVAVSNGGECTRFFFFTTATCRFLWIYDKPKNPVSGWSNPCVQAPIGNGVEPLYTAVNDTAYMSFRANGLPGFAFMSTEFYVDGCIGQRQILVNDFTLEWPITRIGLTSATSGVTGKIGEMSDMWFGDVTLVNGDTYPAVAPFKQFIQVGDLVLPWDRSTPVTT